MTELQWLQLEYDRKKKEIERLDEEARTENAVYAARRKYLVAEFEIFADRLTTVENNLKLSLDVLDIRATDLDGDDLGLEADCGELSEKRRKKHVNSKT